MGNVQSILEAPTAIDAERERFELWVTAKLSFAQGRHATARDQDGQYLSGPMRAGWAAWRARGLLDNSGVRRG